MPESPEVMARGWFVQHRMSVLIWFAGAIFTAASWLFIAIGFGFSTPARTLQAAVVERNHRIDSLALVVDTIRAEHVAVRYQLESNAIILRAVGVDMCQHKSEEFLAQTGVPCDKLLSNLRQP